MESLDFAEPSILSFRVAMRPIALLLSALLPSSFTAQASLTQSSETKDPVYRVTVRLEVVDAQVVSKKNKHAVSSLKRQDFELYEDNVRQEITSFSQDEQPLSVVVLFDLTDSVRPVLLALAEGALEALQHLKPEDEVAVMTYAASTHLVQDFTTNRGLAAAAIVKASRTKSDEAAFFNEGIFQAATLLGQARNPASRHVIIWLTDDVPNIPSDEVRERYGRSLRAGLLHTEKEAMAQALKTDTVVCTLLKRSEISDQEDAHRDTAKILGQMMYPPGEVRKYAQLTGGEVVESSGKKLKLKLAELIDDLRLRYSLSYHPSAAKPAGKFCAIKIKLTPEIKKSQGELLVKAKQGYYR
jgi:VWFA-related protein